MTFVLKTKNKGKIEAGYLSVFTSQVRMGNFSIPTPEFCKSVAKLAVEQKPVTIQTSEGPKVEGSWDPQRKIVKIGRYRISGKEFGIFSRYVFNGGFMGWNPDKPNWKPEFVEESLNYVKEHMKAKKQLPMLEEIQLLG